MTNGWLQPQDFMRNYNSCFVYDFFFSYIFPLEINSDFSGSESLSFQNAVDIYLWLWIYTVTGLYSHWFMQSPATMNTICWVGENRWSISLHRKRFFTWGRSAVRMPLWTEPRSFWMNQDSQKLDCLTCEGRLVQPDKKGGAGRIL